MLNKRSFWIAFSQLQIALLLCLGLPAKGQTILVLDEYGEPVPHAHVQVKELSGEKGKVLFTDRSGSVNMDDLRNLGHPWLVQVRHIGFKPYTDTLTYGNTKTLRLSAGEVALNPAVVTAQHVSAGQDQSVHRMKVIDRARIDAQGAVNLRDVLRHETNMRISQDQILGSSLSIQGISGENVKILIDGVPVIGRLNGNVDLSQINLNNIERIEIVEGPLSVNYGTDALAGTINLITKKDHKEASALINTYYETAGQYNVDGNLTLPTSGGAFTINGGRQYFDGWSAGDPFVNLPRARLADSSRTRQWNPKEQYFGGIQYHHRGNKLTYRPFINYFSEVITNRGNPRGPYFESAFDDRYLTTRADAGLELSTRPGKRTHFNVLAAYNHFRREKNTYITDLTTLNQQLTDNPGDQDTSLFQLLMSRGNFTFLADSTKLSIELGYEVQYETAFGERMVDQHQYLGDYAVFATTEWKPMRKLVIRPGIRATYNTRYNAPVIPSLHLRYSPGDFSIRGSYARGFRAPGLKELFFEFVDINHDITGNEDLIAEQSNNFQVTIDWKKAGAANMFKWSIGAYYNDITNLITLAQIPGSMSYTYTNIGRFKTLGYQGSLGWTRENMRMDVSAALIGRFNSLSEQLDVSKFSYSPELRVIGQFSEPKSAITFGVFYTYTGALPGFFLNANQEVVETRVAAFQMLDVSLARSFFNERIRWTFGAKNLLDVQNIEAGAAPGGVHQAASGFQPVSWGRTIFTSLQINLSWK